MTRRPIDPPPLSPDVLDRILPSRSAKMERLWGAPAIARALGVSVDTVYRFARTAGVPVYHPPGGGYFAVRAELEAWLRTKPPV